MQRSVDHSRDIAIHEARHAAFASHTGMTVLAVHVANFEGFTDIRLPMDARDLQRRWDTDPLATTEDMRAIAGTLTAPVSSVGRLFRGPTSDSAELGTYGRAWSRLRPSRATGEHAPAWLELLVDVRNDVRRWATGPGALMATYTLAHWLLNEGSVDASGWAWLWAQPFARPLHQPQQPAPRTAAAAVSARRMAPDYPVGICNDAWFETHRKQTPQPAPTRSTHNWRPVGVGVGVLVARVA